MSACAFSCNAIHSIGYGRVGIAIREGDHDGPRCIAVGMEQHEVLAMSDLRHGGAEWGAGGTHVLPLRTPAGHPGRHARPRRSRQRKGHRLRVACARSSCSRSRSSITSSRFGSRS